MPLSKALILQLAEHGQRFTSRRFLLPEAVNSQT